METNLKYVAPRTIKRACGGWLAISGSGSPIKIGVTADTEQQALDAFALPFMKWDAILSSEGAPEAQADRRCQ